MNGWVRVDDPVSGYGEDWWKVLDWPSPDASGQHPPGSRLLSGLYGLYMRRDNDSDRQDAMAAPVLLASGVWALEHGRAALADAVRGDVECRRQSEGAAQERVLCPPESRVLSSFGFPICDYYDGRGNVYLAECDCLKQLSLPSMARLNTVCRRSSQESGPLGGLTEEDRIDCEAMLKDSAPSSRETAAAELGKWPVSNIHRLRDRVFRNLLYRYAVRSSRRLDGMQGTFAACTYGPCASEDSKTAYTDAVTTSRELARCPPIRCEASINVAWTGGDVLVDNNMLVVRCRGQLCLNEAGEFKCRNGGRCLQDGRCACEGTGFRGKTCEEPEEAPLPAPAAPLPAPTAPLPAPAAPLPAPQPNIVGTPVVEEAQQPPWVFRALRDIGGRVFKTRLVLVGAAAGAGVVVLMVLAAMVRSKRRDRVRPG
jgi:hypothetical protein